MTDAAAILAQYGNHDPQSTITAAALEHIELAVAATVLEKESNGRNVWGGDPGSTGGVYVKGGPVTQQNYLAYRALVQAGRIGRQGCGPAQCTSQGYQQTADDLGGCWLPIPNMRSGFRGLGALIRTYGLRDGARRYNGSGPMAEHYAADFMTKYSAWKSRLSGASVTPQEDDMTPAQADQLAAIAARLGKFDALEHDLRTDLDDKHKELDEIRTDVAALQAELAALKVQKP